MRYGIAVIGDRVAPRCIFAESILVAVTQRNRVRREDPAILRSSGLLDLAMVLSEQRVEALICGGITREEREFLESRRIEVIDNVAGPVEELLCALPTGALCAGFGLSVADANRRNGRASSATPGESPGGCARDGAPGAGFEAVDCLACLDRKCMRGEQCGLARAGGSGGGAGEKSDRMLEASLDISSEEERTLCRLSELIYFCLEMRYQRIGVAYCLDLQEPASILVRVLRRFFKVYPVCCKIGGVLASGVSDGGRAGPGSRAAASIACNPAGQAEALNRMRTDINVLVGICMGADCVFTGLSDAPVTTLFVKDRSLANNPIGAIYSDYYIKEAIQAAPRGLEDIT